MEEGGWLGSTFACSGYFMGRYFCEYFACFLQHALIVRLHCPTSQAILKLLNIYVRALTPGCCIA